MSGPPRPHHDPLEVTEEVQSLTGRGSGGANRRRRLGGDTTTVADGVRNRAPLLVGLVTLGAIYFFGKQKGRGLRVSKPLSDVGGAAVPVPATPTYEPTSSTDPPVPTYDPTKAGTSAPTPIPTFGNHSYIPDPNPFVDKFNTTEWQEFNKIQWEQRTENSIQIHEMYGSYCPDDPLVPMCPPLNDEQDIINKDWQQLIKGPTVMCIETGDKTDRCGRGDSWLNKTIWPMIRGPKCAILNNERKAKFPMPDELVPYFELGYDRNDPTKSTDAALFDGGASGSDENLLWFDANVVKDHFLRFEAMLEHYYEGLARPLLEKVVIPHTESPSYYPMLKRYSDQIARALLRRKKNGESDQGMLIGVLGDSVTAGQDNCYYDAWPEQFRRQMSPIFGSMGLKMDVRNAAKNGGWSLQPQMLCANDLLGVSGNEEMDFLFQTNPFVHHDDFDAEHMIRRALFGNVHTLVSMTGAERFIEQYASAGLNGVTDRTYNLPEFNMPESGYYYWFPSLDRAFWGMQGDGFCRLTTRAGSASVINRNWHWGPLLHQTYADGYGLLFSRAARQAIDDLSRGRMPPDPPSINDYERVLDETSINDNTQAWKKFLILDSDEAISDGIKGVHCAVGTANHPGSTLLPHWLHPAEESPFAVNMDARKGESFVPSDHVADGSRFYNRVAPNSSPNNAIDVGSWLAEPQGFSPEAPRTADQCKHVDGTTLVNMPQLELSWLTWKVPENAVSIGRLLICHSRHKLAEDIFDQKNVRFHYAVSDATGEWKVIEDTQKNENKGDQCTVIVDKMEENDRIAAGLYGVWVAVEWKKEGIFNFDYLVAM